MLKFAICDDEPYMIKELSAHLSEYMKANNKVSYTVEHFKSGRFLLESGCMYDLIFLDIQMEKPNGMETARMLRQQNNQSLLVFVTVLKEYVFDAFEVEAFDYLIKPLDSGHFRRLMDRVMRFLERQLPKSIVIQRGASSEVILLSQIVYCEVQGRKIYIHQIDGRVIDYYEKLENFEQLVDGRFFKCHRSYLVNLDYVRGCNAGQVILSQSDKIPVSRLRERDLMQSLLHYMKEGAL